MTPDLPDSQIPYRLVLPVWDKLFAAAAAAARRTCPPSTGEAVAALVVRQKDKHKGLSSRAARMPTHARVQNPDSNMASRSHSCSELGESANTRQSPPIRPDYLGALQLLHERQRQWRENKLQQRSKDAQPAPENASHTEEALQMAAPPPFRKQPPAEALFSRITEYLGCLGLDIPVSKVSNEAFWISAAGWREIGMLPHSACP